MDKKQVLEVINKVKGSSKKEFIQKIDLIVNLKSINLKKPEENIDVFVPLKHTPGKTIKVCALVGREMQDQAAVFDKVITRDEFPDYQENIKKSLRETYILLYNLNILKQKLKRSETIYELYEIMVIN